MSNRPVGLLGTLTLGLVLSACGHRTTVAVYAPTAPPPLVSESIAVSPGPGYVWIPGYHSWNGSTYVWVGGRWEIRPQGRRAWIPGHWNHNRRGWYWVDGHWR
jgi:hypothetical protein